MYSDKPKAEPRSYYTPGMSQTVKIPNSNFGMPHKFSGKKTYYMTDCILQYQWRSGCLNVKKTSVGTLQSNRKAIPAEIREIKDRDLLGKE